MFDRKIGGKKFLCVRITQRYVASYVGFGFHSVLFCIVSKRGFLIADSLLDFEELLDRGGVGEESKSS